LSRAIIILPAEVFLLVRRGEPGFVITWLWKNHNGYLFLENELPNRGFKIESPDGDAVRRNLSPDLGHKLVQQSIEPLVSFQSQLLHVDVKDISFICYIPYDCMYLTGSYRKAFDYEDFRSYLF
jgi:hypothetical protein